MLSSHHLHVPRAASATRRHHLQQRGLTLIETVVTVAVLAVGVVGVASGLAASERIAAVNQSQSQLEGAVRQFADWARASPSTSCTSANCPGLPYRYCATSAAGGNYAVAVQNALTAGALKMAGLTPTITTVFLSKAETRTAGGIVLSTVPPLQACFATTCPGATCVGDWGVQEIALKVTGGGSSLTRTIWKSRSW